MIAGLLDKLLNFLIKIPERTELVQQINVEELFR